MEVSWACFDGRLWARGTFGDPVVLNLSIMSWGTLAKQCSLGRVKDTISEIVFSMATDAKDCSVSSNGVSGGQGKGKEIPGNRSQRLTANKTFHSHIL
jgi:hypothetical protein